MIVPAANLRLFAFVALVAIGTLASSCGGGRRERARIADSPVGNSAAPGITAIAVERMLHQLEAAKLGYTRKEVCFSTDDPVSFKEPDPRILAAVRHVERGLIPADSCGYGNDIGRIVDRATKSPRILMFTRTYVYEGSDRAFVLGGWYEHTMSARRYLFIFRRVAHDWKLEDAMRLGAV